jgi:hypothetical protein
MLKLLNKQSDHPLASVKSAPRGGVGEQRVLYLNKPGD